MPDSTIQMGDAAVPTLGYLVSLWALLAIAIVIGLVNGALLVMVLRRQRVDRISHAAAWAAQQPLRETASR